MLVRAFDGNKVGVPAYRLFRSSSYDVAVVLLWKRLLFVNCEIWLSFRVLNSLYIRSFRDWQAVWIRE